MEFTKSTIVIIIPSLRMKVYKPRSKHEGIIILFLLNIDPFSVCLFIAHNSGASNSWSFPAGWLSPEFR